MMEVEGTKPRRYLRKTCWDGVKEEKIWSVLEGCTVLEEMEK